MGAREIKTVVIMSDQIPAWLKLSPGKVLTSVLRLKLASQGATQSQGRGEGSQEGGKHSKSQSESNVVCGKHCRLENISQTGTWVG